ncbi:phospholipid/cholesterol/gamma-HCH transport system substrate-binding protein [Rhodococcus erythropolis]|uniref:Mammalian cell entry protein n=1 Tax=Rhodococcus erythropolis TaxID=1833 RepID=A0A0C2VT22_RHOER|nr:MCE family protein [Rhodococcus erythropolis]KAB2583069.1 mammalian cell entry protein [Rhodococcus erythropolis]KIM17573.1 mammalian cell entry protein [Rhodococcus erythropolis]MCS4253174.1 phospholipid/cholesterol/gamma-HCH transport system substrate-binding protein [Rhodococcus erythropolis]MCW2428377.1 phospholipid/cholesterol/gamma-HCH transport system substrate-binding protein [Rhodococcus erythropolis]
MASNKSVVSVVVALVIAAPLTGCSLNFQHLPLGRGLPGESYPLNMEFVDASLLPVGGEVRIGQAVVGRVTSMSAETFAAVVHTEIESDIELPVGTRARIELSTPIGDAFVNLEVPVDPTGPRLEPGSTIARSETVRGPDVAQLLGAVGTLLNGSGLAQVKNIVSEADQILDGREETIRDLLARLDTFLGTLDDRKESINSALNSLNRLSALIGDESATIDEGLRTLTPALGVIADQRQPLLDLLDETDRLSTATNSVLDQSADQISEITGRLSPILDQFSAMGPTLSETMSNLDNARALLERASPGDYVNIDLDVDVEGTVTGVLNEIIPGAAPPLPPLPASDRELPITTPLQGGTR